MCDDRNQKNLADLKQSVNIIGEIEKHFSKKPPAYLKKLLADSVTLRKQIRDNLLYLEKLEAILARIEEESENLALVLSDLDELKQHAEPNIRIRIESCMVPLAMLQRSGKQIKRAMVAVQQLEFEKLDSIRLDLPSLEQCVVNANIATLRKQQERQFDIILAVAANLRPLIRNLSEAGLSKDASMPECVSIFQNQEVMKKVFSCDAFERKMPSRLRTEPAGEYDRVLGIEGFFEFIYALPAPYDQSVYAEFQFRPEIVKFRNLLSAIQTFRTFADQKHNEWLHFGAFQRLYESTGDVLKFRNELAEKYFTANCESLRESILSKAIAIFLMGGEIKETEVESFTRDFKKMRLPLIKLGRDYNAASDEQKIEIRDSILRQGIPGDPVVRRMWGFKKYPR